MNEPTSTSTTGAQPPRVKPLSETLANQIAAGEVVERPASVLKELLENSLDAGADKIRIEVRQAGMVGLRITDNGCGIHRDDLALALCRHATSKIATLAELEQVRSLGFRGEALPSIASVSRFRLESCQDTDAGAWGIDVAGGEPGTPRPCAHPRGTTVEVRDLFYNTPVRRRFLKTEATEMRHLEAVVRRYALARPGVAISLLHNDRKLLELPAAHGSEAIRRRRARVCGRQFAEHGHDLCERGGDLRLDGYLCDAQARRERADNQYLFVNGRAVNDTVVKHAVRQAYESLYGAGGHPAYVLFLQIEPTDVDVNVHPTKQEVRFCEPRMVHDFVRSAVLRCLQGQAQGPGESRPDVPRETQPIAERAGPAAITAVGHDRGGAALASHPGARTATASESGRRQTQWTGSRPARGDQRQPSGWPRLAAGVADQDVEVDGVVANRFRVRVRADGVYVTDLLGPRQRRIEQRLQALMDSSDSESLAARPLLLPRRLPLEVAASQAMRVVMPRLERVGIRLRIDAAGHCLLLSLPVAYAGMPVDAVAGALEQLASALVAVDGGQTDTITAATRRFVLRLSHLAAPDTAEAGPEVEDRACGQPDEDAVRIDARTLLRLLCESVDGPDEVSRAQPCRPDSDVDG